jgi:hypothetical protein
MKSDLEHQTTQICQIQNPHILFSQGLRVAKKRTPSHNLMGRHIQGRIAYNSQATSVKNYLYVVTESQHENLT